MTLQSWVEVTMRRSMHNLIRYSKSMGFTMPQVNTLFRLHHHDQCSVSDLAEFLGVSDAAVSQMVDKLVDQGLILRIEDPQDRRGKLLSLSPEGNTVVQESIKSRHAWVSDLAELFTPEQEMQVQPALLLLIGKIKQMEAEQSGDCP